MVAKRTKTAPKPTTAEGTISNVNSDAIFMSPTPGFYIDHSVYVSVTTACTVYLVSVSTGRVLRSARAATNGQAVLRFIDENGNDPTGLIIRLSVPSASNFYTVVSLRSPMAED